MSVIQYKHESLQLTWPFENGFSYTNQANSKNELIFGFVYKVGLHRIQIEKNLTSVLNVRPSKCDNTLIS